MEGRPGSITKHFVKHNWGEHMEVLTCHDQTQRATQVPLRRPYRESVTLEDRFPSSAHVSGSCGRREEDRDSSTGA